MIRDVVTGAWKWFPKCGVPRRIEAVQVTSAKRNNEGERDPPGTDGLVLVGTL